MLRRISFKRKKERNLACVSFQLTRKETWITIHPVHCSNNLLQIYLLFLKKYQEKEEGATLSD
jgi:hypothetical protein